MSASWIEEMEKRSHRRICDLDVLAAFQGLVANEIGCARISMMAREQNAPFNGPNTDARDNHLQIVTSGLHRTAGPYRCARQSSPDRHIRLAPHGRSIQMRETIISRSSHPACPPRPGHTKINGKE